MHQYIEFFTFSRGLIATNDKSQKCFVLLISNYQICQINIQGVFLTGTPPKSSKYKKVNLG